MSLPKIDAPIFSITLPSNGKEIKYRQFTVKEEKILLLAQQSSDSKQAILSIKQIINNCIVDETKLSEFAIFDTEYFLINLRAKSVNNVANFFIKDPDTSEQVELSLDINKVMIKRNENHSNIIKINDEYSLMMKYPNLDNFGDMITSNGDINELNYDMMISCMDKLISDKETFLLSEFTKEEIDEFADDLTSDSVNQIKNFFSTMPKLRHELKYKNKNGDEKTFVIEGLNAFFI
jgi:hypothetical protein